METRLTLYSGSVPDPDSLKNLLSPVRKRSIMLAGHKTSVSLEDQFWDGLHEVTLDSKLPEQKLSRPRGPKADFREQGLF
jgi:hypothetical protein